MFSVLDRTGNKGRSGDNLVDGCFIDNFLVCSDCSMGEKRGNCGAPGLGGCLHDVEGKATTRHTGTGKAFAATGCETGLFQDRMGVCKKTLSGSFLVLFCLNAALNLGTNSTFNNRSVAMSSTRISQVRTATHIATWRCFSKAGTPTTTEEAHPLPKRQLQTVPLVPLAVTRKNLQT